MRNMFKSGFLVLFLLVNDSSNCVRNRSLSFWKTHTAALVLARGGSKGIPLKNLATIANQTLLRIALKEIVQVHFDSVWVSTDHWRIYDEVASSAISDKVAINIHWRSKESGADDASSLFAVREFLRSKPEIDAVALIQCTSPFITHGYLKRALALLWHGADCVFSVTRSYKLRWSDALEPRNFHPGRRPRRQDWNGELVENGMFYFAKRSLLERGLFQNNNCKVVEVSEQDSLEIDNEFHLKLAQYLWSRK